MEKENKFVKNEFLKTPELKDETIDSPNDKKIWNISRAELEKEMGWNETEDEKGQEEIIPNDSVDNSIYKKGGGISLKPNKKEFGNIEDSSSVDNFVDRAIYKKEGGTPLETKSAILNKIIDIKKRIEKIEKRISTKENMSFSGYMGTTDIEENELRILNKDFENSEEKLKELLYRTKDDLDIDKLIEKEYKIEKLRKRIDTFNTWLFEKTILVNTYKETKDFHFNFMRKSYQNILKEAKEMGIEKEEIKSFTEQFEENLWKMLEKKNPESPAPENLKGLGKGYIKVTKPLHNSEITEKDLERAAKGEMMSDQAIAMKMAKKAGESLRVYLEKTQKTKSEKKIDIEKLDILKAYNLFEFLDNRINAGLIKEAMNKFNEDYFDLIYKNTSEENKDLYFKFMNNFFHNIEDKAQIANEDGLIKEMLAQNYKKEIEVSEKEHIDYYENGEESARFKLKIYEELIEELIGKSKNETFDTIQSNDFLDKSIHRKSDKIVDERKKELLSKKEIISFIQKYIDDIEKRKSESEEMERYADFAKEICEDLLEIVKTEGEIDKSADEKERYFEEITDFSKEYKEFFEKYKKGSLDFKFLKELKCPELLEEARMAKLDKKEIKEFAEKFEKNLWKMIEKKDSATDSSLDIEGWYKERGLKVAK